MKKTVIVESIQGCNFSAADLFCAIITMVFLAFWWYINRLSMIGVMCISLFVFSPLYVKVIFRPYCVLNTKGVTMKCGGCLLKKLLWKDVSALGVFTDKMGISYIYFISVPKKETPIIIPKAKFRFIEQFHGFAEALGSPSGRAGATAPERAVCSIVLA